MNEKQELKETEQKEVKKGNGTKVGAALGAAAGALGTVMTNPLGRFAVLQTRTATAENIQNFFFFDFIFK